MKDYFDKGSIINLTAQFIKNRCSSNQNGEISTTLIRDECNSLCISDGEYSVKVIFQNNSEEFELKHEEGDKEEISLILVEWGFDLLFFKTVDDKVGSQVVLVIKKFIKSMNKDKSSSRDLTPNVNTNNSVIEALVAFRDQYMREFVDKSANRKILTPEDFVRMSGNATSGMEQQSTLFLTSFLVVDGKNVDNMLLNTGISLDSDHFLGTKLREVFLFTNDGEVSQSDKDIFTGNNLKNVDVSQIFKNSKSSLAEQMCKEYLEEMALEEFNSKNIFTGDDHDAQAESELSFTCPFALNQFLESGQHLCKSTTHSNGFNDLSEEVRTLVSTHPANTNPTFSKYPGGVQSLLNKYTTLVSGFNIETYFKYKSYKEGCRDVEMKDADAPDSENEEGVGSSN